jgi:beta-lactamase class D
MKKLCYLLIVIFFADLAYGDNKCFIIKGQNCNIEEGNCDLRASPDSTFNLILALISHEHKIITAPNKPKWHYKSKYDNMFAIMKEEWRQDHSPSSWIRGNCIWYSQIIAQGIGTTRLRKRVDTLGYGNNNQYCNTPHLDKNNAPFWLPQHLTISPKEQILLLEKMLSYDIDFSKEDIDQTKNLLYISELKPGVKMYGLTGGDMVLQCRESVTTRPGWFIGWIETDGENIPFVYYSEGTNLDDELFVKKTFLEGVKLIEQHLALFP